MLQLIKYLCDYLGMGIWKIKAQFLFLHSWLQKEALVIKMILFIFLSAKDRKINYC